MDVDPTSCEASALKKDEPQFIAKQDYFLQKIPEGNVKKIKVLGFKISINCDTLPLKLTLFLYYGAMAAILPYLTIHMLAIGISMSETAIIYGVLPFTSFIGPPLMGFFADKLGQYKTVLIVATCANAIFHTMLLAVPYYSETTVYADIHLKWLSNINRLQLAPADNAHCDIFKQHMQSVDTWNWNTTIPACFSVPQLPLDDFGIENSSTEINEPALCRLTSGETGSLELMCGGLNKWDVNFEQNNTENEMISLLLGTSAECSIPVLNVSLSTLHDVVCSTDLKIGTSEKVIHGNNALTFWMYFIIRIIATIFMSSCFTLLDATTLAIVKRQPKAEYGTERIWTVIGTAVVSPIAGVLVDQLSRGKDATDYSAAFYVSNILICLNIASYFVIKLDVEKPEKNVLKDARKLFRYPEVVVFLVMIFVLGNMWGFVESYLFVFLKEDLEAPNYLLGLTLTTGSLAGIPFLYWADRIVEKLGRVNLIALAFVVYFIRFTGYAYLKNPWWCFPYEAMEAFTYHLMWTAAATYCSILAPKGLLATLTGIMGALHYSLGKGFGSFIGGYVIDTVRVREAFWDFGVASGIFGIAYFIINYAWLKKLIRKRNLQFAANELTENIETGMEKCHDKGIDDEKIKSERMLESASD